MSGPERRACFGLYDSAGRYVPTRVQADDSTPVPYTLYDCIVAVILVATMLALCLGRL